MKADEIVTRVREYCNINSKDHSDSEEISYSSILYKDDFIHYFDEQFIENAYRKILHRDPDEEGKRYYLDLLRSGKRSKMQIVTNIASSPEAKTKNVKIKNLFFYKILFTLYKVPVVSYLIKSFVTLFTLPKLYERMNALENFVGQYNNELHEELEQQRTNLSTLSTSMADLINQFNDHKEDLDSLRFQIEHIHDKIRSLNLVTSSFNHLLDKIRSQFTASIATVDAQTFLKDDFYIALEDRFRGEELYKKLVRYIPYVRGMKQVLDIGCGRGEWLELLQKEGIDGKGIDINSLNIEQLKHRFDVECIDALRYLRKQKSESIDAISAFHILEHLEFDYLLALLLEAKRVLKPGGKLLIEIPNPKNLGVGACNFYIDPTHKRPLPPMLLNFLLEYAGFRVQTIDLPKACFKDPNIQDFLDEWVNQSEDYGVVGEKI